MNDGLPHGPMDHAAAHERIEDLVLEPEGLAALERSPAPEDVALREHLAGCPDCANDRGAWRRLQVAVAAAVPSDPALAAEAIQPIDAPPALRASVLETIRQTDEPGAAIPIDAHRPRRRRWQWLGLAACVAILAGAGAVTLQQVQERAAAQAEVHELASALAIVDRMLATEHKVVQLRDTDGAPAGTISWSRHDWVVLTTALQEPAAGQRYLCWLESDGRSVPIGHMDFAGGTAYWVATLDEWQTWELGPTTRFVVTLEPSGGQSRTGPAVLEASLAT